jgi:hypothetical protein
MLDRGGALVAGREQAETTMHLDALVVAIGRAARIGDLRDLSRDGLEHYRSRIDIARRADRGIDDRRSDRMNLGWLLAEQQPRHVEVVDHHVAEQPARAFDEARMRRRRIARQDRHQLDIADFASRNAATQRAEAWIETAVEPDHKPASHAAHHVKAGANAGGIEINGLFAEHRLAGAHSALDQVRMGVGRGADDNRVDVAIRDDGIDRADRGPARSRKALRCRRVRIGDRRQPSARVRRDIAAMNAADRPAPSNPIFIEISPSGRD